MALPKFFIADDSLAVAVGDRLTLSAQESHHAVKVRRLQQGDQLMLLNGKGAMLRGVILQCDPKALIVEVESCDVVAEPPCRVGIAVALPKGDRQKTMLDMLAQLGVSSITPLVCEFSVSRYSEKVLLRWQRTLLEACKQSENPFLPQIRPAQTPQEVITAALQQRTSTESNSKLFYADQAGQSPAMLTLSQDIRRITVLVGPEGGFSAAERAEFERNKLTKLRLSPHILRIETAAVAAVAAFVSR